MTRKGTEQTTRLGNEGDGRALDDLKDKWECNRVGLAPIQWTAEGSLIRTRPGNPEGLEDRIPGATGGVEAFISLDAGPKKKRID